MLVINTRGHYIPLFMFAEYDCVGNKIVLTDEMDLKSGECAEPKGISYDQLIGFQIDEVLDDTVKAQVAIKNKDGSMAKNCLNGMRALAQRLHSTGSSGKRIAMLRDDVLLAIGKQVGGITCVEVPLPRAYHTEHAGSPWFVDVGNEHLVYMVGSESEIDRPAGYVPEEYNEEFVFPLPKSSPFHDYGVGVWVFERGVGRTGSCGSGAVAVDAAMITKGYDQNVLFQQYADGKFLHTAVVNGRVSLFGATDLKRLHQSGTTQTFGFQPRF